MCGCTAYVDGGGWMCVWRSRPRVDTRGQGLARTCFLASVHFCASDFIVPTRVQVKGPGQGGGGVRGEAPHRNLLDGGLLASAWQPMSMSSMMGLGDGDHGMIGAAR